MSVKNTANKKASKHGIEPRTARAVMCARTVDENATPEGSGEFLVHSASGNSHVVDLRDGHCSCKDMEFRAPEGGCYHIRRVKLALGLMEIPEPLADDVDPCLRNSRRKFGAAEPETPEPVTVEAIEAKPSRVVADGGRAKCVECGAWLPDEIEPEAGVYCPKCGQHVPDGGQVLEAEPQGSHAEGCTNPECEGLAAETERPILSFECWDVWAAPDTEVSD